MAENEAPQNHLKRLRRFQDVYSKLLLFLENPGDLIKSWFLCIDYICRIALSSGLKLVDGNAKEFHRFTCKISYTLCNPSSAIWGPYVTNAFRETHFAPQIYTLCPTTPHAYQIAKNHYCHHILWLILLHLVHIRKRLIRKFEIQMYHEHQIYSSRYVQY